MGVLDGLRAALAPVHVPFGTIALVALVVALDGLRRLPHDAWVARRSLSGRWRIVRHPSTAAGFTLVAPFAPWTLGVVLAPASAAATGSGESAPTRTSLGRPKRSRPKGRARRGHSELPQVNRVDCAVEWAELLQSIAQVMTLLLVVMVPVAAASFGVRGFLVALAGVLLLAGECAAAAAAAYVDLGKPTWSAWTRGLSALSPFSAPHAAARLVDAAIEGGGESRLGIARRLLDPVALGAAFRETAYDALHAVDSHRDDVAELRAELGPAELATLLGAPAQCPPEGHYCPRCAAQYEKEIAACAACGVVLVSAPARAG